MGGHESRNSGGYEFVCSGSALVSRVEPVNAIDVATEGLAASIRVEIPEACGMVHRARRCASSEGEEGNEECLCEGCIRSDRVNECERSEKVEREKDWQWIGC